jgi:hypothetical protein
MLSWWFCFIFSISAAGRWTRPPCRHRSWQAAGAAPCRLLHPSPPLFPKSSQLPEEGTRRPLWEVLAAGEPPEVTKHTVPYPPSPIAALPRAGLMASLADPPYRAPYSNLGRYGVLSFFFLDKPDTASLVWPGYIFQAAAQNRFRPLYIPVGDADAGQTPSASPPLPILPMRNPPPPLHSLASIRVRPTPARAMVSDGGRGGAAEGGWMAPDPIRPLPAS